MTDDTRRALDSLMGATRNQTKEEKLRKKGNNFKDDSICKFYLLGFCPKYEELLHSTKRDIGLCDKVHSDAVVREYESHPKRLLYQAEYARTLGAFLDTIVKDAENWANREKRNLERISADIEKAKASPPEIPAEVKAEVEGLRKEMDRLVKEADSAGAEGNLEVSKSKMDAMKLLQDRVAKIDAQYEVKPVEEEVCEVCGVRQSTTDMSRRQSHLTGKLHIAMIKIRKMLKLISDHKRNGNMDSTPLILNPDRVLAKESKEKSDASDGDEDEDEDEDMDSLGIFRDCQSEKKDRKRSRSRSKKKKRSHSRDRDRRRKSRSRDRRR